jgi:hypothetical protein
MTRPGPSAKAADNPAVVLAPPGTAVPPALIRAMSRRGLAPAVATDYPAVMLTLARQPAAALLVIEPARWSGLQALCQAIHQYHPTVQCWRFEATNDGCRLEPMAPRSVGSSRVTPSNVQPTDRPTDHGRPAEAQPSSASPTTNQPDSLAATISDPELAILLGRDEPGET